MSLKRLFWLGVGALAGGYLTARQRARRASSPPPLRDSEGRELEPVTVALDGGATVEVVEAGRGPTAILMISGLSGDKEVFRHQVERLSADYRVLACDLRARFEGVEPEFDQFAHDAATILDAFEAKSVVVLGLSFGGAVAIRFASLYPDRVRGLVLSNTLIRLDLGHVGLNRTLLIPLAQLSSRFLPGPVVRRLAPLWGRLRIWVYEPSPGNERVVDYELESPTRLPMSRGSTRMETFRDRDLSEDARSIRQPALVIRGAADEYTPAEWQREIARILPNATYVEIPEAGHLALISHAETFNRVVRDWLDRLEGAELPSPSPPSLPPTGSA